MFRLAGGSKGAKLIYKMNGMPNQQVKMLQRVMHFKMGVPTCIPAQVRHCTASPVRTHLLPVLHTQSASLDPAGHFWPACYVEILVLEGVESAARNCTNNKF